MSINSSFENKLTERSHLFFSEKKNGNKCNEKCDIVEIHYNKYRGHELDQEEKDLMNTYESLDYDPIDNDLSKEKVGSQSKKRLKIISFSQWIVFGATGFSTGLIAFFIAISVKYLTRWRFQLAENIINDNIFLAFILYTLTAVLFIGISSILVALVQPISGGSGIPEMKAYLNGCNLLKYLRLKTLLCKVIGVTFSVSGGLAIGKEGPLVHSGACLAANFSHLPKCKVKIFRNDHDKRNYVSGGAAAGVASAFGAPAGGVLFSFEEASTYWSIDLTWKVFFCAMISGFTLNICLSWWAGDPMNVNSPGLVTFGRFIQNAYKLWELIPFACLAIIGGVFGALFNNINKRICIWRRNKMIQNNRPRLRIAEAIIIAILSATISFWIPYFFRDHCRLIPDQVYDRDLYRQYTCPEGYYNEMANLIFASHDQSIKTFFHTKVSYSVGALLLHFVCWTSMGVVTYGIAVPSGLFVPCILSGCSLGRLMGELMLFLLPDAKIDPGIYAFMGATAMLGGVTRMTISLTVILLETTNDVQYLLPIMMILMMSKWVGDFFNISLYDIHVELKCIPYVESNPSPALDLAQAQHIMAPNPICLREVEKVGQIYDILHRCTHNGFPVLSCSQEDHKCFKGLILRRQLIILLKRRVFVDVIPNNDDITTYSSTICLKDADFSTTLSSLVPDLSTVYLTHYEKELYIDLRPYMNRGTFSVGYSTPTHRIFKLFRSMALRHLPVLDRKKNSVVGMITRKELRTDYSHDLS